MNNKILLKNLINLAGADNQLSSNELVFLHKHARKWGIDESDLKDMISKEIGGAIDLEIPGSLSERKTLMKNLLKLMVSDGEIAEEEMKVCALASVKMQIDNKTFETLLDEVL